MRKSVLISLILALIALTSTLVLVLYNDGLVLTLLDGFLRNVLVVTWLLLVPSLLLYIQMSEEKGCISSLLLAFSVVLTLALAVMTALLVIVQSGTFPKTRGTIKLKGGKLQKPVTISRESNGMVHIVAETEPDLMFAQGYAAAQDRLFQMEIMRRSGQGRVSELVTSDGRWTDIVMRIAGIQRSANQTLANFPKELIDMAQQFCDGINAYINSDSARPIEFSILKIYRWSKGATADVPIEPYQPVDVAIMTKLLSWMMGANKGYEDDRYAMLTKFGLGPQRTQQLEPLYPTDGITVLHPDDYDPHQIYPPVSTSLSECAIPPSILYFPRFTPTERQLLVYSKLVQWFRKTSYASNAWAVSGNYTKTGKPLLANDPHVMFQMPALWWAVHLECKACDIEMIGATLPLVPGIIIGRNKYISFGVTNSFADVQDYYVLEPGPTDETYIYNNQVLNYDIRTEVIKIAGSPDEVVTVKESIFGTYANDISRPAVAAPLIMNMTMFLPDDRSAQGFLMIARAKNFKQFRDAAKLIYGPSLNYVYADNENNIGYQLVGKIPLRKPNHSGLCPVMGNDDTFVYNGYVPFDNLPYAFNPKEGFVASANNRVEPQGFKGYLIGLDVAMEFRAQRITDMLKELIANSNKDITIEDMGKIQTDNLSLLYQKFMKPVFKRMKAFSDAKYEQWRQRMADWDGIENDESFEATVLEMWFLRLETLTCGELQKTTQEVYFLTNALTNDNDPACLAKNMTCTEFAAQSLKEAIDQLEARHGKVQKYGDIHLLQFDHIALTTDFNVTLSFLMDYLPKFVTSIPFVHNLLTKDITIPLSKITGRYIHGPGGTDTVNAAYVLNYPSQKFNYQLQSWHGPTIRLLIDHGENATSHFCHIIGNSGNMFSKDYDNFADDFVHGRYVPFSTANYKVAEKLTLEP